MSFAQRLNAAMDERGLDQSGLARLLGLTSQAVSQWCNGTTQPKGRRLTEVAAALGVTVGFLLGTDIHTGMPPRDGETRAEAMPSKPQANGRGIQVPELDVRPQAGNGAADIDESTGHQVVAHWTMPAFYLRAFVEEPSAVVIIRVAGDSMEPDYPAGERVAVDTSHKVPSPPGVYVLWDGFGLVLKRVEIIPGSSPRKVRLMSINPGYPAYEVPLDEVQINGRVVGKWTWK